MTLKTTRTLKLLPFIKKLLNPETIVILILVLTSSYIRFKDLGYSDYIGDEHKAFIEPEEGQNIYDFFMSRRKGPMQFLVTQIPYLVTHDYRNELAERIPFAICSVLSVVIFYLLVARLTKSKLSAFISSLVYLSNGFIVGFGRIAQYQNLNLLFSFLALYFYSSLLDRKQKLVRDTLLGTLFWSLSILSHWDGVFILPVVVWIFIKFLLNKEFTKDFKIKILSYNFIFGSLLLLPYLIPYSLHQKESEKNLGYLARRLGVGNSNITLYKMYIDLYGPFVTLWFLIILGVLGVLFIKTSYIFTIWFLFTYGIFELFVKKPGTHIYNFLIPVFILCGIGVGSLVKKSPKALKALVFTLSLVPITFLYYQTYMIFVDHTKEYPWEQKKILNINLKCSKKDKWCNKIQSYLSLDTKMYYYDYMGEKLPLFGFPHRRFWNQVNDYISEQNDINNETLGFSSNEDKTISEWYVNGNYRTIGEFYFIGIRRPVNFVEGMNPPYSGSKILVQEFWSEDGTNQTKVFRVTRKTVNPY